MRIGIDARKLWDTGIGTYLSGLLEELLREGRSEQWVLFLPPGRLGSFREADADVEEIEEPSGKYGLRELIGLTKKVHELRLDVFHSPHYTLPLGLRCPSVVTIHDAIHLLQPRSPIHYLYARFMMGHAVRAASRIVAVSERTREDLVRLVRADPERISVIPNGIRPPGAIAVPEPRDGVEEKGVVFIQTPNLGDPPRRYVLYVGSLKRHKNLEGLVHAYATLSPTIGHDLFICGESGPRQARLKALAKKLDVAARVRFLGFAPPEELERLYLGAALFVFPSLYEGFGFPPLEAMARGIPVVCSNRGSLPEVVGDAALLVDPADPTALAVAIARGLRDEELRRDLRGKGLERAARFRWSDAARSTLAIYREVHLGRARTAKPGARSAG